MKKLILCLIALAAMFSIAQAAPFQTLGMLRTPDAYVLPHLAFEGMFVGYYRDVRAPAPQTEEQKKAYKNWFPYAMIGGGILDRAELGVFLGDYTKEDDLTYYFNAKVKIIEETLRMPQISVGMDNILSPMGGKSQDLEPTEAFATHPDRESYEAFSPYAVASKQVIFAGIPWMLNGGFGMNRFIGQVTRSRIFNGLFASLEINPIQDLAILGEFDGEDFNAGVKYSVGNWGAKVGFSAVEDWAKDTKYKKNLRVGIGISYLFDKYAEAKRRRPDLKYVAMEPTFDEAQIAYDEEGNLVEQPPFVAG
ncbi:MAG: hypothetical protein PHO32_06965, partial [Candidatus Cloacimonetes bacterium]|nr:hypothetical protein [Candidatus Cloacimonadota bacterium]